jgi:hypothetical protein
VRVDKVELVGLAEIAALLDVTEQVVGDWRTRYPNFPKAMAELRSGPVWEKRDIVDWAKAEDDRTIDLKELEGIIADAKVVAHRYRKLMGRPLGITGEVAEYEAARLLGLRLANVRQNGYDAVRETQEIVHKLQIKGRCLLDNGKRSQQIGGIKLEKDWDGVLLVLMDEEFKPQQIFEADRPEITAALEEPGSKARNERGALAVGKFKSIGRRIWSSDVGTPGSGGSDVYPEARSTMPTRNSGRTYVKRSEEMVIVGYFLARCGSGRDRTEPPSVLGTSRWEDIYPMFYDCLGGGRTPVAFRNSLQNTRDDFDFYVDNGREGWDKALSQREQAVFDKWQLRSCAELWAAVRLYMRPV